MRVNVDTAGPPRENLLALTIAAEGRKADIAKPIRGFGSGLFEIDLIEYRLKRLKEMLR